MPSAESFVGSEVSRGDAKTQRVQSHTFPLTYLALGTYFLSTFPLPYQSLIPTYQLIICN